MSKKITGTVRLLVPSGKANPSPPVGPALGQRSVNIMDFCKQFNERTKHFKEGILIPVDVTVFNDKSFSFNIKTPSVSYFFKQLIGNGPKKLTLLQLYEIAKIKQNDSNLKDLNINKIVSMLIGSAKSMEIEIF